MPTSPVIEVYNLNVTYGDIPAVQNLSLQVERGELYALLGTDGTACPSAVGSFLLAPLQNED
jgi:ABC-2 type transport system ATP-binding protein